ncbi:hypothetical protein GPECTOR_32g454 [Gonium pectorale]|uniref:Glycosyl transferase CAP10 domain-containing protein n=1 Tax=Gonium pectorale TaxID=33097 RepID=A0A150GDC7_GONPE|nr:hypothetical protein GPECTOR_32g454 [Gonium pectorale]|eukprot:KXZ47842.1 hypothetical protein GPECTOR_32g454 [Gonium pectorale]
MTPSIDITEIPLGHTHVDDGEWGAFLRDNLVADLAPWLPRRPLRANDTLHLYESLMARHHLHSVFHLVLIYNNRIYWPTRTDVGGTEHPHLASPYVSAGPRWCAPSRNCSVPLLSLIKSVGEPDGDDTDLLIPQFLNGAAAAPTYPWHMKKDVAFFRGAPFCSGYWIKRQLTRCANLCPRAYLAHLSALDADANRQPPVLDVGLVEPYVVGPGPDECVPTAPPVVPRVPLANHSYYRWLLHVEGVTASNRLSQLLLTNSLVVSQHASTPWVEWYYRSLRPGVHFVPFWNTTPAGADDVYDVISELRRRDAEDPSHAQRIIGAAQRFAARLTGFHARVRYLADALAAYKALFADMDPFLEQYVGQLRARGFKIP